MNTEQKLAHLLTEWDRKQTKKKYYNPYALGLYLEQLETVMQDINKGMSVIDSLKIRFNDRLRDYLIKEMSKK